MRVLLTGAGGQLGREFQLLCPEGDLLQALGRSDLDITSREEIDRRVTDARPEVIVNAAAYTAVDRAEEQPELAASINAEGTRNIAMAAAAAGVRLIHLSTDFVFGGNRHTPYPPSAATEPLGVYGQSKRRGEKYVLEMAPDLGLVLRTSWVYSRFGHNFVKTMLTLVAEREEVSVVADQIGSPTWARGLATAVWAAAERQDLHGVLHWTDAGVASWYDFAIAIQEEAESLGLLETPCRVLPIATSEFPTPARRPSYSVLDSSDTHRALDLEPIHWRRQLRSMLQQMRDCGEE